MCKRPCWRDGKPREEVLWTGPARDRLWTGLSRLESKFVTVYSVMPFIGVGRGPDVPRPLTRSPHKPYFIPMLITTITLYLRGLAAPPCTVALTTFFPRFIQVRTVQRREVLRYALSQHRHLRSTFFDIITNVDFQKYLLSPRDLTAFIGVTG